MTLKHVCTASSRKTNANICPQLTPCCADLRHVEVLERLQITHDSCCLPRLSWSFYLDDNSVLYMDQREVYRIKCLHAEATNFRLIVSRNCSSSEQLVQTGDELIFLLDAAEWNTHGLLSQLLCNHSLTAVSDWFFIRHNMHGNDLHANAWPMFLFVKNTKLNVFRITIIRKESLI